MNLDAMRTHSEDETVDAVVIGTGAGALPSSPFSRRRD